MKNITLKSFLDTYSKNIENKNDFNSSEQVLENFFNNVTAMILDNDILVVLLDDKFIIKSIFSNDNQKYGKFGNRKLLLSSYPRGEKMLTEIYNRHEINMFISRLFSNENAVRYRLMIISMQHSYEKYKVIIDRLSKTLNALINYYNSKFSSYENLLTCLDAVDDGISACDSNGIITYINKAGCDIIDGKKEELLGRTFKDVATSNSILAQVLESKKTYMDFEYFFEYKGKTFHLMNSAYPVYDKDNNMIGAIDNFRRIKRTVKIATDLAGHEAIYKFENFIGNSKALQDCIDLAQKFAQSSKNILMVGESGTGKELFAQAIQNYGRRKEGPFVAINCASFPKDLFDSELFGYDEGAFTGARKGGKIGKFELANGGTLFLDEIGEMSIHLQAKLLRVLETRSLSRIGSNKKIDIDVRIIAATNKNLEEMIKSNNFREDLYYRLKVLYLSLPPLSERGDDCIELTNYFINKFSMDGDKKIKGIDNEAKELIKAYPWPGNIRELENVIALSLFFCDGEYITKNHLLKAGLKNADNCVSTNTNVYLKLSEVTKETILQTLEKTNGNKRKAAEILGISRNTIYRSLK